MAFPLESSRADSDHFCKSSIETECNKDGRVMFNKLEYCFPNQVLTLWNADPQYDCRRKGTRDVWGQVGLRNEAYVSVIKALEGDA